MNSSPTKCLEKTLISICFFLFFPYLTSCTSVTEDPDSFSGPIPNTMQKIDSFGDITLTSCINLKVVRYRLIPIKFDMLMLASESQNTFWLMEIKNCASKESVTLFDAPDIIQSSRLSFHFPATHGVKLKDGYSYADSILADSPKICRSNKVIQIINSSLQDCEAGDIFSIDRRQAKLFLGKLIEAGEYQQTNLDQKNKDEMN